MTAKPKTPAHAKEQPEGGAWDHATAGTYVDQCTPRTLVLGVLIVALVVAIVPSVGMFFARTDSTTENRELAAPPTLFAEDGAFNWNVLADSGTYFDDHFALRNQLVTANAKLRASLGASATDQVVVGTDDWLYYGGTLPDYLGQSALSDRTLLNITHNLSLAQRYAESQGAAFLFTIAPNKNSLYDGHMPYYYVASPDASNAERLKPLLDEAGVNYFDLFDLFGNEGGLSGSEGDPSGSEGSLYYLLRDTHWDNRGALVATQAMFDALGRERLPLGIDDATARDDFTGDLESMLYPNAPRTETQWYFAGYDDLANNTGSLWSYVKGADVTDSSIVTESPTGTGSLLMFRDSFGNALLPLWAASYKDASFTKLVPYNLGALAKSPADTVVIERAERHVDYLAKNPPIMPNPTVTLKGTLPAEPDAATGNASLELSLNGPYLVVTGAVDQASLPAGTITDQTRFLVSIEQPGSQPAVYDSFWQSAVSGEEIVNDFGYQTYIAREGLDLTNAIVRTYAITDGKPLCLSVQQGVQTDGQAAETQ